MAPDMPTALESNQRKIADFVHDVIRIRDPDLAAHLVRLDEHAGLFARHIGLASEEAGLIALAAGMHDVGKLGVDNRILHKPAKLTEAEFSIIREHPVIGHRLIAPLGLHHHMNDSVLHHHENYDGSGYPHGLSGASIPLAARIVRICDSYDAMIADRPYHRGKSPAEALAILQQDERCYDPELLRAFLAMMREKTVVPSALEAAE